MPIGNVSCVVPWFAAIFLIVDLLFRWNYQTWCQRSDHVYEFMKTLYNCFIFAKNLPECISTAREPRLRSSTQTSSSRVLVSIYARWICTANDSQHEWCNCLFVPQLVLSWFAIILSNLLGRAHKPFYCCVKASQWFFLAGVMIWKCLVPCISALVPPWGSSVPLIGNVAVRRRSPDYLKWKLFSFHNGNNLTFFFLILSHLIYLSHRTDKLLSTETVDNRHGQFGKPNEKENMPRPRHQTFQIFRFPDDLKGVLNSLLVYLPRLSYTAV